MFNIIPFTRWLHIMQNSDLVLHSALAWIWLQVDRTATLNISERTRNFVVYWPRFAPIDIMANEGKRPVLYRVVNCITTMMVMTLYSRGADPPFFLLMHILWITYNKGKNPRFAEERIRPWDNGDTWIFASDSREKIRYFLTNVCENISSI